MLDRSPVGLVMPVSIHWKRFWHLILMTRLLVILPLNPSVYLPAFRKLTWSHKSVTNSISIDWRADPGHNQETGSPVGWAVPETITTTQHPVTWKGFWNRHRIPTRLPGRRLASWLRCGEGAVKICNNLYHLHGRKRTDTRDADDQTRFVYRNRAE